VQASRESPESGLIRRWVEALAFVGVWIAAGVLLDMSPHTYLVFGIPLTAGFQLFVRKRPIKDLWVRGGLGLSLRTVSLKLAILLAIVPFVWLVQLLVGAVSGLGVDTILYGLAAIVGAGAAAYALGQFTRETWLYVGLCLATAGLLGVLIFIGALSGTTTAQPIAGRLVPDALQGIQSLLILLPVMFMMEEVAFRGAIDSHVRHPGERHGLGSTVYGIVSAIAVSVLWGLWHLPIVPLPPHMSVILWVVMVVHLEVAVGPFLSLFWRRSGNLMVPGFAHAMMDSVRNALGGSV
jgi:membrane protease YdiL (CAAX protease family)